MGSVSSSVSRQSYSPEMNRNSSRQNTGHSTLNTRMSRGSFLRGAGLVGGAVAAAGLGWGGVASAQGVPAGPKTCEVQVPLWNNATLPGFWCGGECIPVARNENPGRDAINDYTDSAIKDYYNSLPDYPPNPPNVPRPPGRFCEIYWAVSLAYLFVNNVFACNPQIPISDINEMPRPNSDHYAGEDIARLNDRTATFEIVVDQSDHDIQVGYNPNGDGTIKLRGWYIQGMGLQEGKVRPLLIMQPRLGTSFFGYQRIYAPPYYPNDYTPSEDEILELNRIYRHIMYFFAMNGWDVAAWDIRGHGYSQGSTETDAQFSAEDVFAALNQLEDMNLLGNYNAKTKPVVFYGVSLGSTIGTKAMQINYDKIRGYNFRGMLEVDGMVCLKYIAPSYLGLPYFPNVLAATEASMRMYYNASGSATSEVFESIPKWPAYFPIKGLVDFTGTPDGIVEAFNRAKGRKDILMSKNTMHALYGNSNYEQVYYLIIMRMIQWANRAVLSPPEYNNYSTTTLQEEVCKAPGPDSGVLHGAETSLFGRFRYK